MPQLPSLETEYLYTQAAGLNLRVGDLNAIRQRREAVPTAARTDQRVAAGLLLAITALGRKQVSDRCLVKERRAASVGRSA